MKIEQHKSKKTDNKLVIMVSLNEKEALSLISSLVNQLISGSSNVGRLESYTFDGTYFSIAVEQ